MPRSKENFVHLHVHSDMSKLDGCARIRDYAERAAERGSSAVALTDHGTVRGLYNLTEECDRVGIKPIYGVEFYVCEDMYRKGLTAEEKEETIKGAVDKKEEKRLLKAKEEELSIKKRWHLTAWALDNDGLRNLYKLTTRAWDGGYYYKPRIDLNELEKYNKGLAIGTGCIGSMTNEAFLSDKYRREQEVFDRLFMMFADRLYLEVMPHKLSLGKQARANQLALHHRKETEGYLKLLATQDAHYVHSDGWDAHKTLLAVNTHKRREGEGAFQFSDKCYWFKTEQEMRDSFREDHGSYFEEDALSEAINTTMELAERCTAKIDINPLKCLLPPAEIPAKYNGDEVAYFVDLVQKGLQDRGLMRMALRCSRDQGIDYTDALKVYRDRIRHEFKVLKKSGFIRYFLVIRDIYKFADRAGIAYGPGRGSAAGSLIAYLIGITHVDPIQHRLMFERFIAPGRVNMPDIDCDFEDTRRGEILDYLNLKLGKGHVAQISTFSKMAGKQSLKDVVRAYGIDYAFGNAAAAAVDSTEQNAIEKALEHSEVLQKFKREWPEATRQAILFQGMTKTFGVHAAGIVASPVPLEEIVPLEIRRAKEQGALVTAFDLRGVEGVGLLKIDILGLRAITALYDAKRAIEKRTGEKFVYNELPLDDKETLQGFTDRDFIGVFQFDSSSAHSVCDGLKFVAFDDIAVVNAINRPGAFEFADEYKERRLDPKKAQQHVFHPKVSEITADALGLMIYQEHVIKVATQVAGYSPSDADKLRKKIAKSAGEGAMEVERATFIEGCIHTIEDLEEDAANRLFDQVVKFGRYGFNRSHAVCYSMLSYWTMYLKKHHPLEFYKALMQSEKKLEKIQRFARDAKEKGVETLLPDVNISTEEFVVDYEANAIRGSLLDVKGIGPAAIEKIVGMKRPFGNFVEFIQLAKKHKLNKGTVTALAMSGALDSLVPNPRWLVGRMKEVWEQAGKERWKTIGMAVEKSAEMPQWTKEQRLDEAAEVNPLALRPHPQTMWQSFLHKDVSVDIKPINDDLFAKAGHVYTVGTMSDMESRTVGDNPYSAKEYDEKEYRHKIGWGEEWIKVTVDGVERSTWMKVSWQSVKDFEHVLRRGVGTPLLISAEIHSQYQTLFANYFVNLKELVEKCKEGKELTLWERLFVKHPSTDYPWKYKSERMLAMQRASVLVEGNQRRVYIVGIVVQISQFEDKRGQLMSRVYLAMVKDCMTVVCFGSAWPSFKDRLKVGMFVKLRVTRNSDGKSFHLEAEKGAMKILNKVKYERP